MNMQNNLLGKLSEAENLGNQEALEGRNSSSKC